MRRLGTLYLIAVLGLGFFAACDLGGDDGESQLLELARRQRVLWRDQNINDYTMTYQTECTNCATVVRGPFEVVVRGGEREHVIFAGDTLGTDSLALFFTIEALFDFIEEGFARSPDRASLVFHPDLNYPVTVIFDYDLRRAGEEDAVQVTNLVRLGGAAAR